MCAFVSEPKHCFGITNAVRNHKKVHGVFDARYRHHHGVFDARYNRPHHFKTPARCQQFTPEISSNAYSSTKTGHISSGLCITAFTWLFKLLIFRWIHVSRCNRQQSRTSSQQVEWSEVEQVFFSQFSDSAFSLSTWNAGQLCVLHLACSQFTRWRQCIAFMCNGFV